MQDFSILTVSSPFSFKTLFTKPLKYVIQIFTGDGSEHIAKYYNGEVINVSGKGFERIKLDQWLKYYKVNGAKIHEYQIPVNVTPKQKELIISFDNSCIDKEYDVPASALSVLDEIKIFKKLLEKFNRKDKGIYCSQQAFSSLVAGEIFSPQNDRVNPAELKRILINNGWKKIKYE